MFLNPCLPPTKIRKTAKIQSCSFNEQETTPNLNNFMVSSTNSMSSSKSEPKKVKSSSNFTELSNNSQKNQISNLPIDDNSNFFAKFPQNTRLSNQNLKNHPFRNLIFSPEVTVEKLNNYISLIQRGLIYSRTCLKQPSAAYLKNKSINLSEKKKAGIQTILFDLDETLIHTCDPDEENPQYKIRALTEEGELTILGINVRPYCIQALHTLSKYFEIYVFTASSENYANSIVDFLDSKNEYISGIISRKQCLQTNSGFFIKDLRILNNRELKDIVIVDNMPHSFGFQIANGIPILEWVNEKDDSELKYLTKYLLEGLGYDDLRVYNREKLKLEELIFLKQ